MKQILTKEIAEAKLKRMALEVAERNIHSPGLILIGIREQGLVIAQRVAAYLAPAFSGTIKVIGLSLNKKDPGEISLEGDGDLKGKNLLLIDDVANSGRTMLHALKPIIDKKPARVETLALIERTHKKYPVAINYVGLSVSTTLEEHIEVLVENGEVTGARMQ